MRSASAPEVSGPVATMHGPGAKSATSPVAISMPGGACTASSIQAAKRSRSTASAPPAGTRQASAAASTTEPSRRSSSCSRPTALCRRSERRLFEHTSSAKRSLTCAGERLCGFISHSRTRTPRRASASAASQPARPAPITVTRSGPAMKRAKITRRAQRGARAEPRLICGGRKPIQPGMASGKGTGKSKGEEGYGEGFVELDLDDDVLLDEAELTSRLAAVFESPGYRPPRLPDVAVSLLELSRRPEASIEEFAALLEQDALLAGEVMKLVRSPVYAGQAAVKTIQQALVRIGIKNLRDLVMQAALGMRVFRCDAYQIGRASWRGR